MKIKGSAYSCELSAAADARFDSELPIPAETGIYAAKRFILHSPLLRRICTARSYRLRLGAKNSKLRTLVFEVPARMLELPGESARITAKISQAGVTITAVSLKNQHSCTGFRLIV